MVDYRHFAENNHLQVDVADRVATVTINRPERMNSMTYEVHTGLEDLFVALNRDQDIRAVILTGAGNRAFSAGADLKAAVDPAVRRDRSLGHILKGPKWLIHNLLNLEHPIIAAINGDAVGLGCTIALTCDITIMADTARIGDTHTRIGLVAGDGGALILPFIVGMHRAKEMLMTGRLVGAAEAKEMGLVNRVVPHEKLMEEARALALELANGAPMAIRWTKAALNQQIWQQLSNSLHYSLAVEALTAVSEDRKEGVQAFIEKRPPKFQGR